MEINAIEASQRQQWTSSGRGRGGREFRPMICFRCRKFGHQAAVCRTPTPVVAHVEHVASDDKTLRHNKNTAGNSRGAASRHVIGVIILLYCVNNLTSQIVVL
ncbi:hypothetical protein PR003_g31076 [Phytophthora rubi]|uniref:CCHC-type domain-containing protein n=1 Tax=Phytophthora rubi TaxID=129364 RepID=A0A6A3H1Q3_9STRA|nr:hypothetical protein PR001_g29360 [Phytophthora rubi]KAE9269664.1 hypothetical protein PR003_g31076 [Phytophthora rubi]